MPEETKTNPAHVRGSNEWCNAIENEIMALAKRIFTLEATAAPTGVVPDRALPFSTTSRIDG